MTGEKRAMIEKGHRDFILKHDRRVHLTANDSTEKTVHLCYESFGASITAA